VNKESIFVPKKTTGVDKLTREDKLQAFLPLSHAESIRRGKYDKENQPTKKTASRFLILACEKTTKLQVRGKSKHIPGIH